MSDKSQLTLITPNTQFHKGDIFAALTRSDVRGKFHWIIYVVKEPKMGYKIHVTNRGETPWHFECIEWEGPDDILAVAFVKMGRLDDDLDHVHLLEYVKDIPMVIPPTQTAFEPNFTCRVWFKEAIRRLDDAGMFVQCDDVDGFERELVKKATAAEYLGYDYLPLVLSASQYAKAWSY